MMKKILKWFIQNLILTLVFSATELKWSLKMLAICNRSVTVAPLCVFICTFDVHEHLIAIKALMPFHIFLRLFNPFTSSLYLGFPFKKAQCSGVKILSILVIKEKNEYLQKYTSNLLTTIHFRKAKLIFLMLIEKWVLPWQLY